VTRRPDGALEADVMRVLWDAEQALLPGEINEQLDAGYAYTSIATVLNRLHAKQLVTRTAAGRAYVYEAAVDEPELAVRRITALLDSTSDRAKVLSRFVDSLPAREAATVRALLDRSHRGEA
jgi:predicted transcriptional regulator